MSEQDRINELEKQVEALKDAIYAISRNLELVTQYASKNNPPIVTTGLVDATYDALRSCGQGPTLKRMQRVQVVRSSRPDFLHKTGMLDSIRRVDYLSRKFSSDGYEYGFTDNNGRTYSGFDAKDLFVITTGP